MNTSFPAKGEKCVDPKRCLARHQKIKAQFEVNCSMLLHQHQLFLEQSNWEELIELSIHAKRRMAERAIGMRNLLEVLEHGEPIPCEGYERAIMGRTKVGKGLYRTIHVIFRFEQSRMKIITLYDPAYSAYLYDPAYSAYLYDPTLTHRFCWCAPHPTDF